MGGIFFFFLVFFLATQKKQSNTNVKHHDILMLGKHYWGKKMFYFLLWKCFKNRSFSLALPTFKMLNSENKCHDFLDVYNFHQEDFVA